MCIMNINLLKSIIKECVREGVKEELESLFGGNPQPTVKRNEPSPKTSSLREMLSSDEGEVTETPTPTVAEGKVFKKYTNNEMLNQILNETKALPQDGPLVSGMRESEIISKSDSMLRHAKESNPAAETVLSNALTRDYSKLLKAIDKKAKDPTLKNKTNLVTA